MMKTYRLVVAAAAAAVIAGAAVHAQETRSSTLLTTEHYLDWERVSDAQIAPDGSRIVYTRQHVNQLEDKWESEIWTINTDGWPDGQKATSPTSEVVEEGCGPSRNLLRF